MWGNGAPLKNKRPGIAGTATVFGLELCATFASHACRFSKSRSSGRSRRRLQRCAPIVGTFDGLAPLMGFVMRLRVIDHRSAGIFRRGHGVSQKLYGLCTLPPRVDDDARITNRKSGPRLRFRGRSGVFVISESGSARFFAATIYLALLIASCGIVLTPSCAISEATFQWPCASAIFPPSSR